MTTAPKKSHQGQEPRTIKKSCVCEDDFAAPQYFSFIAIEGKSPLTAKKGTAYSYFHHTNCYTTVSPTLERDFTTINKARLLETKQTL